MATKVINRLLGKSWFPVSLRLFTLVVFIVLIVIGFSSPTNNPVFVNQLSKTNLTTSFVWRLWWPLLVLSAIFLGRVWCMICPVEMVTTFFAKVGFKRKRPKLLLSGWGITIFYFVILIIGITILEVDMNPEYTSYYLLFIMAIAIASGLIFEKNTFCGYICPVGYLLGFFSKMSIWGYRVKDKSICGTCTDKSCIKKAYIYQISEKSCGVDLHPANIKDNSKCLLCGGCLKTCKTYKTENNSLRPNPGLQKIGFASDLMQLKPIQISEWVFLFLLTGSMIFEMTHFQIAYGLNFSFISSTISSQLNLGVGLLKDLIEIIYLYLVLPSLLWFSLYLIFKIYNKHATFEYYIKNISNIFLPVISSFFVGLVFMEVLTKIPYYKFIVKDPRGVETIKSILFKQIEMPQMPDWSEWAFSIFLILVLILGILFSFIVIRKFVTKLNIKQHKEFVYALPVFFILILYVDALMYQLF